MILRKSRKGGAAPPSVYTSPAGERVALYANMLAQPHLLIAGTTGSGKSVVINALVYTGLYAFPDEIGFILIDPKRVELAQYRRLPHIIAYSDRPETHPAALALAMRYTEKRFQIMQECEARRYNGGDLYVIIDEFADLITTQRGAVVPLVQRLAQIGRAARVHVILATQTPIAKVLPTEIKCNFDARLALRTRSAQDSRNIIGVSGCERLPRYGFGYYYTPAGDVLTRLPMYSDAELTARVRFWQDQI